ncbi:MAG: 2,3-bisphosphoglycerate-independent phosphoglycerate mutase [Acidiferrobacterales bacterium]|nr:2,3-bisphosphoglycerate-independent phosphoglycerate mutase [Acidiferrobacterales bacterium]
MALEKLATYQGSDGPVLLVVADGVGIAPDSEANAVSLAQTPVIDKLMDECESTKLYAHGTWVGLPSDSDMGNSEVGHNALGSGQIISQGAKLVNQAFSSGSLYESEAWKIVEAAGTAENTVHFLGLLSDGNIHSHIDHLLALVSRCDDQSINTVRIHILLDGRDVDPRSAIGFVSQLEDHLNAINQHPGRDYRIASGGGRMRITMDRYEADWQMVKRGYDVHVHGIGNQVNSVTEEIQRQYTDSAEVNDQTLDPFVVVDASNNPIGKMADGDAVVFFNFRGDRGIEISQALESDLFEHFDRGDHPQIFYCGMLQYDGDLEVPKSYLVNPPVISNTMVEFLCAEGLKTFAVSETQKFGHVTYFWNGNRSEYFDDKLESWVEIPSDVIEFNQAPAMKAQEITDATIQLLQQQDMRFGRINFANGDMVGHTGDVEATVMAMETVDRCVGNLLDAIDQVGGVLVFTADHGNADEMFVEKGGVRIPRTSHTLNQVPFAIYDPKNQGRYEINHEIEGGLANVAATVFNLMGYRAPMEYQPSLIRLPGEPLGRRTLHHGAIVNLGLETVKLPNDEIMALEIVRHVGGSVVVAMDSEERVCLIKQFRHAAGGWIWEFPAGLLESGEEPEKAAMRELQEETGCTSAELISLGSMLSSPGFCTERLHLFLAKDVVKGEPRPEKYEFIETHWLPLDTIFKMADTGEIDDAKTVVTLFRLKSCLEKRI